MEEKSERGGRRGGGERGGGVGGEGGRGEGGERVVERGYGGNAGHDVVVNTEC